MANDETDRLRSKLEQARAVIAHLVGDGRETGAEGQRAIDYFSSDRFDPQFLPWPRPGGEGTRPEDLNAANDG